MIKHDMDHVQLDTYFSKSPIGTYVVQDSKFCFSNAKFQEIMGYSESQLLDINPIDLVVEEDQRLLRRNAISMLKNDRSDPYEFRVTTKNGSELWIIESVASITYQGKKAVMGHFMDVTENKLTENALKSSENKYRSIFELAREGILIVDFTNGKIIDANLKSQQQSGYSIFELKQKDIWNLQPTDFQEEAKASFFRFKEKSGGLTSWKLLQNREGKIIPVEILGQHMTMDNQDVIICMIRDTSEREAMIKALTVASKEWRKTFDAMSDVVMLISPDFIIQRANQAAANLFDMSIKQVVGMKCYTLVHNTEEPPGYCPHLKTLKTGISCECERTEPYLDKVLHFCSAPIKDERGRITHTVEVISDKTTQRKSQAQSLKLSKDLANSFKGITQALSGLVESRDPYTAGHSKHVAELAKKVGEELGLNKEDLEGLQVCAILHDIGKATIPAGILNKPGKLSDHEMGFIKEHPTMAYETLSRIPFPWPVAEVVHQHHERLDGTGYPLGLKDGQIHPWAKIIAVADIYDAMTSHRPYRPGLPLKEAIDELNSGLNSRYDADIVAAMNRLLTLESKRILVVDGDAHSLNELSSELKHSGFDPVCFTDSKSAMNELSVNKYPLIITEISFSGNISGIELTKKAKDLNPDAEVVIIADIEIKEGSLSALRAGASDFLEKPLNMSLFNKTIHRAVQRYAAKKRR